MIEVFKTNVLEPKDAARMITFLSLEFPGHRINFDLNDCDNVLRIEGRNFDVQKIILVLKENGFECEPLD